MNILSPLTGAATDTGTVTTNVTDSVSCTASDSTIAFGNLASSGTNNSDITGDHHVVENNGNVNLTIQAYASAELWDNYAAPTANWQVNCNATQTGVCNSTYANLPENGGSYWDILDGLEPGDATDEGTFSIKITAPADEPNGEKSGTVTYYCISV